MAKNTLANITMRRMRLTLRAGFTGVDGSSAGSTGTSGVGTGEVS